MCLAGKAVAETSTRMISTNQKKLVDGNDRKKNGILAFLKDFSAHSYRLRLLRVYFLAAN